MADAVGCRRKLTEVIESLFDCHRVRESGYKKGQIQQLYTQSTEFDTEQTHLLDGSITQALSSPPIALEPSRHHAAHFHHLHADAVSHELSGCPTSPTSIRPRHETRRRPPGQTTNTQSR